MNGFGWQGSWNPWRALQDVERQMNRLFGGTRAAAFPPVNVYNAEDGAVVMVELPGVDPADLDARRTKPSS